MRDPRENSKLIDNQPDMSRVAVVLALFLAVANGQGFFRLANFYQNDMVLQMEPKSAVIWGYGEVDARVEINFENTQLVTVVNDDGTWRVVLPPHAAGGPVEFSLRHNNVDTVSLSAWFGDVWLCSGHSNMEMPLAKIYNSSDEIRNSLKYQNIRLLQLGKLHSVDTELDEIIRFSERWAAPNAVNVQNFSALCLLYGERLSEALGNTRPIGLIDSCFAHTRIEAWVSPRVPALCNTPPNDGTSQNSESALWNSMIAPLTKTSIRGAIWTVGESNTYWNQEYFACHIAGLYEDWKNTFFDGEVPAENGIAFPFGVVQAGPVERGDAFSWGAIRFHQTADKGVLPNALIPEGFFAASYDLTDRNHSLADYVHFRDKQTVADRLANAARKMIYGQNFRANGPIPISAIRDTYNQINITYDSNIKIVGLDGFMVLQSNGSMIDASIITASANSVVVSLGPEVVWLGYAYDATVCEYKQCAVYSDDAEALPAQVWSWNLPPLKRN